PRAGARRGGLHGPGPRRPRRHGRRAPRGALRRSRPDLQGDVPMITALLTHEWRRTRSMVGAATGIALLVVAAAALLVAPGWPGLSLLGVLLGAAALGGYVPVLQVLLAVDYWRSSYGRIGYFTQTLPIRGG